MVEQVFRCDECVFSLVWFTMRFTAGDRSWRPGDLATCWRPAGDLATCWRPWVAMRTHLGSLLCWQPTGDHWRPGDLATWRRVGDLLWRLLLATWRPEAQDIPQFRDASVSLHITRHAAACRCTLSLNEMHSDQCAANRMRRGV